MQIGYPGGGGGAFLYFHIMRVYVSLFLFFYYYYYNYFFFGGGGAENLILLFFGSFLCIYRGFLKFKVKNGNTLCRYLNLKYFLGMPDIFWCGGGGGVTVDAWFKLT